MHTCGLDTSGSIKCWGNGYRQTANPPRHRGAFVDVSTGQSHSCGVDSIGSVICWGWNKHGQTDPPSGNFVKVQCGRRPHLRVDHRRGDQVQRIQRHRRGDSPFWNLHSDQRRLVAHLCPE